MKIAGVDEYKSRVQDAHRAVHGGDALGLLGTVHPSSGAFHAGGSAHGVLEVARDSVRLFREVMWALFQNCTRYSPLRKLVILQGILEAHSFNSEQNLGHKILLTDADVRARFSESLSEFFDIKVDTPMEE